MLHNNLKGRIKMTKLVLNDGTNIKIFSNGVCEMYDSKIYTFDILIPDDGKEVTSNDINSIIESIESSGVCKIVSDNETLGTNEEFGDDVSFVLPNVTTHIDRYLIDRDEDGNEEYAKCAINVKVMSRSDSESYISHYKTELINSMSKLCHTAIESGLTISLSDGEYKFSYTDVDRENISEMFNAVVVGATAYPYHEDGGNCRTFTASDIVIIYSSMVQNKTHHTTYFNQLKQYINSLTDIHILNEVHYGQELTGVYLDNYNNNMAEAAVQLQNILKKIGGN